MSENSISAITFDNTHDIYELVCHAGSLYQDNIFLRWETDSGTAENMQSSGSIAERTFKAFRERCDAFGRYLHCESHCKSQCNLQCNLQCDSQPHSKARALHVGILGIVSDPSVTILMGTMAAGCVAVPLDLNFTEEELAGAIRQADTDILFCDEKVLEKAGNAAKKAGTVRGVFLTEGQADGVLSLEDLLAEYMHTAPWHASLHESESEEAGMALPHNRMQKFCTPDTPALIVFTSGTTGKRKGVLLTHGNLIDNLFNSEGLFHPEGEVYLNVLPMHHVYCIANDILWVFCYGRPLCLNRDMSQIMRHMQMFRPSIMFVVPAIAKGFYGYTAAFAARNPGMSLREAKEKILGDRLYKLFCGGGALSPQLSAGLGAMGIMAAQGYGMSECSPKITYLDWSRKDKFTSVGRPAKRMQLRFVDGEIQVKGPSVMKEYYNDPEETALIFTEDGWLKTGDVGYQDEEGFIYLTGRKKNIIVLGNGENVSPEEIEAKFGDDRLIADICVLEKDDQLAAEVYPDAKAAAAAGIVGEDALRAAIAGIIDKHNAELPFYKQIRGFMIRKEPFPKTTSGKLIRQQYRAETADGRAEEAAADPAEAAGRSNSVGGNSVGGSAEKTVLSRDALRERVRSAVIALIGSAAGTAAMTGAAGTTGAVAMAGEGKRAITDEQDLFEAGLDSLGGIMLLSELEAAGIPMKWEDLVQHPTIAGILRFADQNRQLPEGYPALPVYPLTNMQIWFAHILRGNTTANLPFLIRLQDSVDTDRLRSAVAGAIDRHPGIKGQIWQDADGQFGYYRMDAVPAQVTVEELTDEAFAALRPGLVRAYDYTKGEPLYRAVIYRTPGGSYLFLDVGHIVSDGMTMTILFQDIESLYAGREVPAEKYTYFDFVLDEQKRNGLGLRARDIRYFTEQMKDLRITKSILTKKDFGHLEKGDFGVLRGYFPRLSRPLVSAFCKQAGISDNILFNAAFNYTISLFRNEHDAACCTIHSGRTDGRWTRLAGPLFMSCYFRFREIPGESVGDALRRLAGQNRETMQCFVSNLKCDEMFFQYQGDFLRMNRYEKIWKESIPLQLESQPFHLQIIAGDRGFGYEQRYWKNRFDEKLLSIFLQTLEAVVLGMMTEQRVEDVRRRLPQSVLPGLLLYEGKPARIVNDEGLDQPVGGWGHLMTAVGTGQDAGAAGTGGGTGTIAAGGGWTDTGRIARSLPDGSIDDIENGGRTIMIEGLLGRRFVDLTKLEKQLTGSGPAGAAAGASGEMVRKAECFVAYSPDNTMKVYARINDSGIWDQEQIEQAVKSAGAGTDPAAGNGGTLR